MEINDINIPAVRAFNKIMLPIYNEIGESYNLDLEFSHGEDYSNGAFQDMESKEELRVATMVGEAFGEEPEVLLLEAEFLTHYENNMMWEHGRVSHTIYK